MTFKQPARPIDTMYYIVKIPISNDFDHDDLFEYLTEKFGISGRKWDILVTSIWDIHFKDSKDAMLFRLGWNY